MIAALRTQLPESGEAALAAMGAGWRALREAAIPLLLNDLLAEPDPIVPVLDDYHVISNQQVHATLALLLERMPPALHLVICSRGETHCQWGGCTPKASCSARGGFPVGSV